MSISEVKLSQYKICAKFEKISQSQPEEFVKCVNDSIKEGWKPYGNLTFEHDNYDNGSWVYYVQPLVK